MLRSRIHVDAENTQQQQQRHAHKTPGLKQSLGPQRQAQTAKPDTRTQNALGKSLTTAVNRTLLRDKTNTTARPTQSREVPKTPTNLKKAQLLQTPLPSLHLLKTPSPNPLRRKLLSPTPAKEVEVAQEPEPEVEIDWSEREVECAATDSAIDEPYAPEGLTDWRTTTVLAALRSLPVYVDGWDEAVDPADDTKFELVPWEECQVMRDSPPPPAVQPKKVLKAPIKPAPGQTKQPLKRPSSLASKTSARPTSTRPVSSSATANAAQARLAARSARPPVSSVRGVKGKPIKSAEVLQWEKEVDLVAGGMEVEREEFRFQL